MYYKFLKDFETKGDFEECLYDDNPGYGTYSRTIEMTFHEGQLLNTDSQEESSIIKIDKSGYGVSIHGSTACVYNSIKDLLDRGIICKVSDEQAHYEEAKADVDYSSRRMKQFSDICLDPELPICEEMIDEFIEYILFNIQAKADLSISKIALRC